MEDVNIQHEGIATGQGSSKEEQSVLGLVFQLGKLLVPAQTEEQAAVLGPDYFESRLPLTVAEENRFVELFGYYPNGMGL